MRPSTALLAVLSALGLVAAVVTVNFLLLGVAARRDDPVGKLTPRANLAPATRSVPPARPTEPTTTARQRTERHDGEADD